MDLGRPARTDACRSTDDGHYVEEGGWISRADMAVHALEAAEDRAIRLGEFKLAIRFRKAREGMRRTDADDGFRPLKLPALESQKGRVSADGTVDGGCG